MVFFNDLRKPGTASARGRMIHFRDQYESTIQKMTFPLLSRARGNRILDIATWNTRWLPS